MKRWCRLPSLSSGEDADDSSGTRNLRPADERDRGGRRRRRRVVGADIDIAVGFIRVEPGDGERHAVIGTIFFIRLAMLVGRQGALRRSAVGPHSRSCWQCASRHWCGPC